MSYGTAWLGLDRPTLLEWDLALTTDNSPTQTRQPKNNPPILTYWIRIRIFPLINNFAFDSMFPFKFEILKYENLRTSPSARLHSPLLQTERSSYWLEKGPGQCKSKLYKRPAFSQKFAPDLLSLKMIGECALMQAVLNIHLPAARTPEQTHAQIQVVHLYFIIHLEWNCWSTIPHPGLFCDRW